MNRQRARGSIAMALTFLPLMLAACEEGQAQDAPPLLDRAGYSFRDGERPVYDKAIAATDLEAFQAAGGIVLDVRLAEDFAADSTLMPGSARRDPDRIAEWAGDLSKDRPVALYCVKGKWVSQKAAAYLAAQGLDAYSVEGGLEAWKLRAAER